jgi:hypothetical protein
MKLDRHIIRLTLLGLALAALASGATLVRSGMTQLNAARAEAATARQTLEEADERLKLARVHARWVDLAQQTVVKSQSLGLTPQNWIERKVNLRTFSTSRPDAERLLRETSPDNGRLFVAEDFELFSPDSQAGLFDVPAGGDRITSLTLTLTLRGSYFARDSARSLTPSAQPVPAPGPRPAPAQNTASAPSAKKS